MNRALIAATLVAAVGAVWWAMRDDVPPPSVPSARSIPRDAVPLQLLAEPTAVVSLDGGVRAGTALVSVTNANGAPMAAIEVTAAQEGGDETAAAATKADGVATFTLTRGGWRFRAKAKGFVRAEASALVTDGAPARLTLELRPGALIRGRVVTSEGVPVPGAKVAAAWKDKDRVGGSTTATATDGAFAFEDVPPDERITLRATSNEHPTAEVGVRAPDENIRIVLKPGRVIHVRVKEPTGQPAIGATVSLFLGGLEPAPGVFRQVEWRRGTQSERTGLDGSATFRGVPPGAFALYARHEVTDGGDEGAFGVAKGTATTPTTEIEIQLRDGTPLTGRVVDPEGAPVALARVMVKKGFDVVDFELTENDGRFALTVFDPGPSTLTAIADGFEIATVENPSSDVTVRLKRLALVTGRVVDPSGAPVTKFEVNDRPFEAKDGRFAVPRARFRTTEIEVTAPGYALTRATDRDGTFGDVVLSRGRGVTVTVVDAVTQAPIAGAEVRTPGEHMPELLQPEPLASAKTTGGDGTLALEAIADGAVLQVVHPGFVAAEVAVPPGASTLRVALDTGGLVHVRIGEHFGAVELSRQGQPGRLLMIRERSQSVRLAAGRYALRLFAKATSDLAVVFEVVRGREVEVELGGARGEQLEIVLGAPAQPGDAALAVPGDAVEGDWRWFNAIGAHASITDGVAQFPALPPGRYTILVGVPGRLRATVEHGAAAERLKPVLQAVR